MSIYFTLTLTPTSTQYSDFKMYINIKIHLYIYIYVYMFICSNCFIYNWCVLTPGVDFWWRAQVAGCCSLGTLFGTVSMQAVPTSFS